MNNSELELEYENILDMHCLSIITDIEMFVTGEIDELTQEVKDVVPEIECDIIGKYKDANYEKNN